MTKRRIACFHAHHSNIEHIENALVHYDVETVHFVDPGLDRIKNEPHFTEETAKRKIKETLAWISSCHVDAVLITCSYFTANLEDDVIYPIPIVKIDEPLFQSICEDNHPVLMAYTNPNTVTGSMRQLVSFADQRGASIRAEPVLLENTFELIMQGKKQEYVREVSQALMQLAAENPDKKIIAAQLSMVPAAEEAEHRTGTSITSPIHPLTSYLVHKLDLQPL